MLMRGEKGIQSMNFFEASYKGTPPWDIGRPQPEFVQLEEMGEIKGPALLDAGCGTGDNAFYFSEKGYEVTGIDSAPTAIETAKRKARGRKLVVEFKLFDALELERLGRIFDTVLDSGLFHVFSNKERRAYVTGLAAVLAPGGMFHMLCFSEREKGPFGPRRVTQREIHKCFGDGWEPKGIKEARFATNSPKGWSWAWLASYIRR